MKLREVRPNNHQQHLESLILFGKDGINEINNKIENFIKRLNNEDNNLITTTKIDGSPSIFMWSHIDGYPDNSIALKGFINGAGTALSSNEEIEAKYGDRPDMADKLKQGLRLAKYIPNNEAWQGDCLFTQQTLNERDINGKNYLTFQPNKIIYAFSENNPGYNNIKNADFGIAFHTVYTKSGNNLKQSFNVDLSKINAPNNFYLLSPAINSSINKEDYNVDEILNLYNKLKEVENKLINDHAYNEIINNKTFMNYWTTFENKMLSNNKSTNINVDTLINDLIDYTSDKLEKNLNKKLNTLKTDDSKQNAIDKYNSDLDNLKTTILDNENTLRNIVLALNLTADIKMLMLNGLKKIKQDYDTFYKSKTKGYFTADPEGIAMSDTDGNIVKLVDRSAFSSYNKDPDIESGWEHKNEGVNMKTEEFAATQSADMGSYGKFTKLILDEDSNDKVAVVAVGRMNPPTKGHAKLIDKLVSVGNKYNVKPKLFLTHTTNNAMNPLSYESKVRWAEKSFGDKVEIVKSNARTLIEFIQELYNEGYTDLVYIGSDDRIGGREDVTNVILKYNGNPDSKGNLLYNFDSIKFESSGKRDENSVDPVERISATAARNYAIQKDFDNFKDVVALNEKDAKYLFDELRYALKNYVDIKEDYLNEIKLTKKNYTPEIQRELDVELDKIDKRLDAPDPNMDAYAYRQNIDKYTGLFTKQGSTQDVVYSAGDIKKLYPEDYDKILKELDKLSIEDSSGRDFDLTKTGTNVITKSGGGLDSTTTTLLQEAISGLILGNRIKEPDIKEYLIKSDPIKRTGIFNYLNFEKNITQEDWNDFIKKWGNSFNVEQANKDDFINVANSILNGNINDADIIHDAIKNKYSNIARGLLTGADQFDKSDVYFCVGDTDKILKTLAEFRKNNDIVGYVNFMVNNSDKIIGVSLKQVGKTMRVVWDIPPKTTNDFSDVVYWPKTEAKSQALVFEDKDGEEKYILAIRSNSNVPGSTGAVEWREDGGKAMMGKGASKLESNFGPEFTQQFNTLRKEHKYAEATKLLLEEIAGTGVKPGEAYMMTKEGKKRLVSFFNDSCGFNSVNSAGERVSAPYIKVY